MQSPLSAHRALNVVSSITLYRAIGRRPSAVFVDDGLHATRDSSARHRLWDIVFLRMSAEPGDQIQDRPGGIVLVTKGGDCHPVQLSAPKPRSLKTAFTHADRALAADRELAERMLAEGQLAAGPIRRPKQPPFQPSHVMFKEDCPLVVSALPDAGPFEEAIPQRSGRFGRGRMASSLSR